MAASLCRMPYAGVRARDEVQGMLSYPARMAANSFSAKRSWPPRSWPIGLRLRHIGGGLPPALSIPPGYPGGVGVTPRLLAVHIGHPRRQPILGRGALAGCGTLCLDRGHDLFSSPAVLPAADRVSQIRTRESLRVVDPGPRSYLRAGRL